MVATPQSSLVNVAGAANFDADNGHAYFRKSPWVSSDLLMTLRYRLAPEDRGLARGDESPFWHFPRDYVARFEAALEKANPELRGVLDEAGAAPEVDAQ